MSHIYKNKKGIEQLPGVVELWAKATHLMFQSC